MILRMVYEGLQSSSSSFIETERFRPSRNPDNNIIVMKKGRSGGLFSLETSASGLTLNLHVHVGDSL